uniref:Uncharacterized protein n=1 Tax=Oryzias melastigma TaxID=30732 RepID=A0A3B3D1P4_ORYME
ATAKPAPTVSMDTLPAHLLPLVMEEFPQSLATACVCRAGQREPRLRCVQCGIIEEEEEDASTLEEDQAQRSFLQTLESLRRTLTAPLVTGRSSLQSTNSPDNNLTILLALMYHLYTRCIRSWCA